MRNSLPGVVPRMTTVRVCSVAEAMDVLNAARSRSLNWTHGVGGDEAPVFLPNRAHAFLRMVLYNSRERRVSTLHIIDLVGSASIDGHRHSYHKPGEDREFDRRVVNQHLLALSRVITELARHDDPSDGPVVLSARESRLTQIIGPLLVGNSKTFLLATIQTDRESYLDTTNTLRVAARATSIKIPCMRLVNVDEQSLSFVNINSVLSPQDFPRLRRWRVPASSPFSVPHSFPSPHPMFDQPLLEVPRLNADRSTLQDSSTGARPFFSPGRGTDVPKRHSRDQPQTHSSLEFDALPRRAPSAPPFLPSSLSPRMGTSISPPLSLPGRIPTGEARESAFDWPSERATRASSPFGTMHSSWEVRFDDTDDVDVAESEHEDLLSEPPSGDACDRLKLKFRELMDSILEKNTVLGDRSSMTIAPAPPHPPPPLQPVSISKPALQSSSVAKSLPARLQSIIDPPPPPMNLLSPPSTVDSFSPTRPASAPPSQTQRRRQEERRSLSPPHRSVSPVIDQDISFDEYPQQEVSVVGDPPSPNVRQSSSAKASPRASAERSDIQSHAGGQDYRVMYMKASAECDLLRKSHSSLLAQIESQRQKYEEAIAHASDLERDFLEKQTTSDLESDNLKAEVVNLKSQIRKLQKESSHHELFAQYDEEIRRLTEEVQRLKDENASLREAAVIASVTDTVSTRDISPSSERAKSVNGNKNKIPVQKALAEALSRVEELTAEAHAAKKKERQALILKKAWDDANIKLSKLSRELQENEKGLTENKLRVAELDAQLRETQSQLQQALSRENAVKMDVAALSAERNELREQIRVMQAEKRAGWRIAGLISQQAPKHSAVVELIERLEKEIPNNLAGRLKVTIGKLRAEAERSENARIEYAKVHQNILRVMRDHVSQNAGTLHPTVAAIEHIIFNADDDP
mmetsp:Transcript_6554/g.10185  ORF Transcript_6554/g.10185 Transcript_6554/m.10185 type:complete len:920 (-) Transcript_6554:178-2937(-)